MSIILMYHSITESVIDTGIQVRPETFMQHLRWAADAGYRHVTVQQAVAHPRGNFIALTFDDGFQDNLPISELLAARGIQATLYVCAGLTGQTAAWASNPVIRPLPLLGTTQLQTLQRMGITIGCHSWQHTSFRQLSAQDVHSQLQHCMEWHEQNFGCKPDTLAYPYGHCTPELHETVSRYFSVALAVEPISGIAPLFAIPRMAALEEFSKEAFLNHLQRYDLSNFFSH